MKETRRTQLTLRDWLLKVFPSRSSAEGKPFPVEQITPQKIAEVIDRKREAELERVGKPERFHRYFDITDIRAGLKLPHHFSNTFHLDHPKINQAIRIVLRELCASGVLNQQITPNLPNDNREIASYSVADPNKLDLVAKGASIR